MGHRRRRPVLGRHRLAARPQRGTGDGGHRRLRRPRRHPGLADRPLRPARAQGLAGGGGGAAGHPQLRGRLRLHLGVPGPDRLQGRLAGAHPALVPAGVPAGGRRPRAHRPHLRGGGQVAGRRLGPHLPPGHPAPAAAVDRHRVAAGVPLRALGVRRRLHPAVQQLHPRHLPVVPEQLRPHAGGHPGLPAAGRHLRRRGGRGQDAGPGQVLRRRARGQPPAGHRQPGTGPVGGAGPAGGHGRPGPRAAGRGARPLAAGERAGRRRHGTGVGRGRRLPAGVVAGRPRHRRRGGAGGPAGRPPPGQGGRGHRAGVVRRPRPARYRDRAVAGVLLRPLPVVALPDPAGPDLRLPRPPPAPRRERHLHVGPAGPSGPGGGRPVPGQAAHDRHAHRHRARCWPPGWPPAPPSCSSPA